jgi:hypothetical protein
VSRREDPAGTIGVAVALIFQVPFCALVIWSDKIWTFEPLDALTDVAQHLIAEPRMSRSDPWIRLRLADFRRPDALSFCVTTANLNSAIEMLSTLGGVDLYPEAHQILVLERIRRELQSPPQEIRLPRETFEALPRDVQQLLSRLAGGRPRPQVLEGIRRTPRSGSVDVRRDI